MENRIIMQIAPLPKPATFKDTTKVTMRVAAYARVSKDHEDQQSSLVAQTEYYKNLIAEHPGWQFVQVYVDDGISGLGTRHREGCCDACRRHWWSTHMYMVERKAYYDYICPNCGKEFRVYGNSKRKYCCHECYNEHRFG